MEAGLGRRGVVTTRQAPLGVPVGVGVLVSGRGSNLRALALAARAADFPAVIRLVVCNRSSAGAVGLCAELGLPIEVLPLASFGGDALARDRQMVALLRGHGVDLVVCAGYDRLLSDDFLGAFPDAILNVHPSLLPAFGGGMNAVEMALEAGVKISGCTVQLLEPGEPDGGPIVLQAAVPVAPDDDADQLRERIHAEEWRLLPEAVALWACGRLSREGRRVRILGP